MNLALFGVLMNSYEAISSGRRSCFETRKLCIQNWHLPLPNNNSWNLFVGIISRLLTAISSHLIRCTQIELSRNDANAGG